MTTKLDPASENVPPVWMLPVRSAPVENETEPSVWPGVAVIALKLWRGERADVTPALEIEIEPCTLTKSIVSANAATGNANANNAKTQTRLIFSSKDLIAVSQSSTYE